MTDIEASELGKTPYITPARRRESTVNNRHFQGEHEQEWTAARCHRLLRALTSRVAILNKEFALFPSAAQSENDLGRENSRAGKGAANIRGEEDWVRTRRRIRRTYSKKTTRKDSGLQLDAQKSRGLPLTKRRKCHVPGQIAIPTPILARARGELPAEPVPAIPHADMYEEPIKRNKRARTRYTTNHGESQFQLSESLLDLRKRIAAARYTTYEGIYSGLEALLRATNRAEQKRKGSSSLLLISLRAIPRYITQQEALLRAHMEDTGSKSTIENRDLSTEIYGELETFGSSGHGWKRLRVLVRSHGIQVLSDAICAGLLDVEFSGALIALCVNTSAIDEAQTLLSALLSSRPCPGPKTPYDIPSRPFTMLWKFTEHTGRSSFQYRQLSDMVSSRILPLEWLATKEFGPVWTRVIHSLSPGSDNIESLMFLDLTLPTLSEAGTCAVREKSGAITEAVRNTFCSLLATLSSIVILSRGATNPSPTKETGSLHEYEHVSSLLRSCLAQQNHSSPALDGQGHLVLLANLLAHNERKISTNSDDSLINSFLRHLMRREEHFTAANAVYRNVIEFICLVARCCGRGVSSSGFEHLERLHLLIESSIFGTDGGSVLKGLIIDSAFAFAQQVPDRKHIDYAITMDKKLCARRLSSEDSLLAVSISHCEGGRTGFRWEEGIGEWVTATPAILNSRKTVAVMTDSDHDAPFRPPSKLRLRRGLAKESSVDPPSPLCKDNLDKYPDISDLSTPASKGGLDGLGGDIDSDQSMSHGSSPKSDDELESTGPPPEIQASFLEDSFISDNSSLSVALHSARSATRHKALTPAPRLSRRLFYNPRDCSSSSTLSLQIEHNTDLPRDYVERVPRLGRRALQSSQAWQIFDESDDELSFLTVSSEGDHVLQNITNTAVSSTGRPRQASPALTQNKSARSQMVTHNDSEDELCL